jgi:quercetin dioxygenase-like cupin family protein
MPDRKGAILARNEGRFGRGLIGDLRIKIGAAESEGALSLVEYEVLPGRRSVPHYHLKIYEAVFISEGELRVRVDDTWSTHGAGATVLLPIGVVHAWDNRSSEPARILIISTPASTATSRTWPISWRVHPEVSLISSNCASSTGSAISCWLRTDRSQALARLPDHAVEPHTLRARVPLAG